MFKTLGDVIFGNISTYFKHRTTDCKLEKLPKELIWQILSKMNDKQLCRISILNRHFRVLTSEYIVHAIRNDILQLIGPPDSRILEYIKKGINETILIANDYANSHKKSLESLNIPKETDQLDPLYNLDERKKICVSAIQRMINKISDTTFKKSGLNLKNLFIHINTNLEIILPQYIHKKFYNQFKLILPCFKLEMGILAEPKIFALKNTNVKLKNPYYWDLVITKIIDKIPEFASKSQIIKWLPNCIIEEKKSIFASQTIYWFCTEKKADKNDLEIALIFLKKFINDPKDKEVSLCYILHVMKPIDPFRAKEISKQFYS